MLKRFCILAMVIIFTAAGAQAKKMELSAQKTVLPGDTTSQFTLGLVQTSLSVGMSQADVIRVLGSPNIVTRDSDNKDTWVYDKIYTEKSSLDHNAGATVILVGWNRSSQRSVQTQKTITTILKFDKNQRLESYTYHNSQF